MLGSLFSGGLAKVFEWRASFFGMGILCWGGVAYMVDILVDYSSVPRLQNDVFYSKCERA